MKKFETGLQKFIYAASVLQDEGKLKTIEDLRMSLILPDIPDC